MSLTVSASGITFDDLTTLSTGSISAVNLAPSSVGTLQLSAGAVTANKINLVTSLGTNGYQIMPGGLILQWGSASIPNSPTTGTSVTFPIPFPNACLCATANPYGVSRNTVAEANNTIVSVSTTTIVIASGQTSTPCTFFWMAIGY